MAHLPSEHLGQARVLRDRIMGADHRVQAGIDAIGAMVRLRYARKNRLTPELARAVQHAWATTVTDGFALNLRVTPGYRSLRIAELRPAGSRWRTDTWVDPRWEPGIALVWVVLIAERDNFRLEVRPVAQVLLHGLARRFQRGDGRDDAAVLRDLRPFATALATDAVEIPVPAGRWVGRRVAARDDGAATVIPMLHVQTFLN